MTNASADIAVPHSPADPPLTPGEVLTKLFLDNADKGANPANADLVAELLRRMRAIQALAANPSGQ
ncbi:MAG TPA: hypothetical protein VFN75_10130 [Pseudonocardiaceae bacterium]|nr:hypothetical protein [Pseudonocardiaceae bacterium]